MGYVYVYVSGLCMHATEQLYLCFTGSELNRYDTDVCYLFRQESFFLYLFGVNEPDLLAVLDLSAREAMLFIPRVSAEYELWCGKAQPPEAYLRTNRVDAVFFTDEVEQVLSQRGIEVLHVITGQNSDSKLHFDTPKHEVMKHRHVDASLLYEEIVECRVIKSQEEVDVLSYVGRISSEAHVQIMKQVRPGMFEYQLEGIFKGFCISEGGCRYLGYTCISCTGKNSSVLHYGHATAPLECQIRPNDMLLLDMGAEYQGYCADITCSFPAGGKFNDDHREGKLE